MNNTKSLAIVAVLTAATLVIGVTFAAATPSAFAQGSGNTNTTQSNKQKGIQSGFDNSFDQELQNLICTHPGEKYVKEDQRALCLNEES